MKKVICLILCISAVLAFSSCKKGNEDVTTTQTEQTSQVVSTTNSSTTAPSTEKQSTTEKTTEKTTTPMPSTKASEAVPITVNEALDRLSSFYGAAYNVNATVKEGNIQYFKITDKKDNLYARVEVNLKTSDAKETIEHSGEVNEFNLSV